MSFLRHVGKIGDRKVAIVFREVPNEPHMALVTYTESLNRHLHDPMMQCIESDIGQNSKNLADALNRTHTKDGKYILQVLHVEGLLKKVKTETVIVTPNGNTKIRLDELNKILTEMENGEDAVKRLAEINSSTTTESAEVAKKIRGDKPKITDAPQGVLGDNAIANNLRSQAARMEAEAKGLFAESLRLQTEAAEMDGFVNPSSTSIPAKKRGRPAKATVTA